METNPQAETSQSRRQPFLKGWRLLLLALSLALIFLQIIRAFLWDVYLIPSSSMEPTLLPGDRIIVSKLKREPVRGQLIVFDGQGSLAPYRSLADRLAEEPLATLGQWAGLKGSETTFIKRVIALEGDTVHCCSDQGQLTLNGQLLEEPYLPADLPAGTVEFTVTVPEGRMWVMGDNRPESRDSRALLGAPGGGMIRVEKVIGQPIWLISPANGLGPSP